jgi:hypothetical protein
MKLKSLLLGSAAAAGLATGAFAADPAMELTTLNVCDSLGKSGLTISSDTNCLQITGEIKYEFNWGNYNGGTVYATPPDGDRTVATPDGAAGVELDWASKLEWYIKFVATADTTNGPAAAVIKIKEVQQWVHANEALIAGKVNPYTGVALPGTGGDHTFGLIADEAYVSIGGATVLMIGKKGSLINKGDDEPLTFIQTFNSDAVDKGVFWVDDGLIGDGGAVIQATTDLGNGVSASAGLEKLDATGTAVGLLEYKGEGISAHITVAAGGILDGTVDKYAVHAGFTGTFDTVTFRAAIAADSTGYYNALATAQVVIDLFKIAATAEIVTGGWGVSGSVGATVADGVELNIGAAYFDDTVGPGVDGYKIAASISAAVTETIKLTAEVGDYGTTAGVNVWYGALEAAYNPGGGLTASIKGEAYSNGAFKATVKGAKVFD